MSKRLLLLPCLLLLSALALAACGSSGGGDETSKVEETIETAATSTNPADCAKFQTQKFMAQTNSEGGKSPQKGCEEAAEKGENAKSVAISNVEVDGSSATAEVALTGTVFDGQTLEVALVKQGDRWKLDEIVKLTKFDQEKLVESFEREIKKSGEPNSKFVGCFVEALEEADRSEVEDLVLKGSSKGLEESVENCS